MILPPVHPRIVLLALASVLFFQPARAQEETPAPPANRPVITLTLFRNPATGLELRYRAYAIHAGHYPTIIPRDGRQRNTTFVRIGTSVNAVRGAVRPYAGTAFMISLSDGWSDSMLFETGLKVPVINRIDFRLGCGLLVPFDGERVRLNPTVGAGVRLW